MGIAKRIVSRLVLLVAVAAALAVIEAAIVVDLREMIAPIRQSRHARRSPISETVGTVSGRKAVVARFDMGRLLTYHELRPAHSPANEMSDRQDCA